LEESLLPSFFERKLSLAQLYGIQYLSVQKYLTDYFVVIASLLMGILH